MDALDRRGCRSRSGNAKSPAAAVVFGVSMNRFWGYKCSVLLAY
jgi:hypothetical protein